MKKSIIYTCTGDSGMTSLVGGKRVAKNDIRIEAYGSVDELNSQIGLLASQPDISDTHRQLLVVTQNKLFNLGAYLATDMLNGEPAVLRGLDVADIEAIERAIDEIDARTTSSTILCCLVVASRRQWHMCVARRAVRANDAFFRLPKQQPSTLSH